MAATPDDRTEYWRQVVLTLKPFEGTEGPGAPGAELLATASTGLAQG